MMKSLQGIKQFAYHFPNSCTALIYLHFRKMVARKLFNFPDFRTRNSEQLMTPIRSNTCIVGCHVNGDDGFKGGIGGERIVDKLPDAFVGDAIDIRATRKVESVLIVTKTDTAHTIGSNLRGKNIIIRRLINVSKKNNAPLVRTGDSSIIKIVPIKTGNNGAKIYPAINIIWSK